MRKKKRMKEKKGEQERGFIEEVQGYMVELRTIP